MGRIRSRRSRPLPLTLTDRLPAEIMGHILDDASHDIRTLHACLLVCTAWRSYLIHSMAYENILVRSARQLHRLACAARHYPSVRDRLASVRSVILQQDNQRAPGFAHVFPHVLGPLLHKVERLSFGNCTLQPLHRSFFSTLRQLKGVKRLELSMSSPQNFADFRRIVCAFPQLEELDVLKSWSRKPSQLTPPHLLKLPCPPKLTSVRIIDVLPDFFRDLVSWLSSSGVCSTIRKLDISVYLLLDREAGPVNTLLAHTASTLEHLRMLIPIDSTHSLLHAHSCCHIACRRI